MRRYWWLGVTAVVLITFGYVLRETKAVDEGITKSDLVWLNSFDAAKKEASLRKLPILVNFSGSDWCGWCLKLDREVFSKPVFQEYAKDHLVLLLVDFPQQKSQTEDEKEANRAMGEQYGVRGFPTVLLLDGSGRVLKSTGYRPGGAGLYVEHLKELLKEGGK